MMEIREHPAFLQRDFKEISICRLIFEQQNVKRKAILNHV
jgi:hypothetical protein